MAGQIDHRGAWRLAKRQHGVVSRAQLLELGLSRHAIAHKLACGRLHQVAFGVYAVGRPVLGQHGRWMAAVLSCGPCGLLSHRSAAALWQILAPREAAIHVSVPAAARRRRPGLIVHRRSDLGRGAAAVRDRIPVTSPVCTLVDLAATTSISGLETAINEADKRDLVTPHVLRRAVDELPRRPGVRQLRTVLDRRTFVLTDSKLERRFLPLARKAGLPKPQTRCHVNGFRVDFFWPHHGLIVETDGLRYHRTPAQQARDRLRDQVHAASGLTPIRFTHAQIRYEPERVCAVLRRISQRLGVSTSARWGPG